VPFGSVWGDGVLETPLISDQWIDLNRQSDEELAVRLAGGEQDALAVLFDRYHRLVFSVAMRIVQDTGEAEEVVQTGCN
jgi:hypothetical protein